MSDLKFDAICNSVDEHPVSALRDDLSTRLYLEPRSTESERGHLTSLWKKGAGENLYVHALPSFLPSFLSFSPDPPSSSSYHRRQAGTRTIFMACYIGHSSSVLVPRFLAVVVTRQLIGWQFSSYPCSLTSPLPAGAFLP